MAPNGMMQAWSYVRGRFRCDGVVKVGKMESLFSRDFCNVAREARKHPHACSTRLIPSPKVSGSGIHMSSLEPRSVIGAVRTAATQQWTCHHPLALELEKELPSFTLANLNWGAVSEAADNAVIVCHASTGSADADDWWGALFGLGPTLDPSRDFIVCSNVLIGCYGSTGPAPAGSVEDMVEPTRCCAAHCSTVGNDRGLFQ